MVDCNKIVLVIKASEVGERALKKALDLLGEKRCSCLGLLFVVDHEFFSGSGSGYIKPNENIDKGLEGIADAILRKMEDYIEEHAKGVKTQRIILHGETAEEILNYVKSNNIDILVIPKDKRGPIEKYITGGEIEPFIEDISKHTKPIVVE